MFKTTIIVPVWGKLEFTKAFIDSLYRETNHGAFNLIVVDNASPDKNKTAKYLKKREEVYDNMTVITNKTNLGYIGGINAGLKHIDSLKKKPDYIIFGNNDVEMTPEWLPKMERWFDEYENLGALGPISNNIAGPQHIKWQDTFGDQIQVTTYLIGFWMMVRYSVYEKVGKLDDAFGLGFSDDIDYSIRVQNEQYNPSTKYSLGIARDVMIYHEGSATYKDFHKTDKDYKADLQKKHDILVKKWGEDRVNEVMNMNYYHGTVIIPTIEVARTPFAFSLFNFFNTTKDQIKFYAGKSTMSCRCKNEGLKETNGEWTLVLNAKSYFKPNIVDQAKHILAKTGRSILVMYYLDRPEVGAVFIKNSVLPKLSKCMWMLHPDEGKDEDDYFMEKLDSLDVPYDITYGVDIKHVDAVAPKTTFISSPHKVKDTEGTIGVPCVDYVHTHFLSSMANFLHKNKRPLRLVMTYEQQVDSARNEIVDQMKGDYVWFVDSDEVFDSYILDHILSHKKQITTAVVYKKMAPYMPCIYMKDKKKYGYNAIMLPLVKRHYTVDMCGTGCVVIAKDVFKKLKKPYFEYNEEHGEDIHFFEAVKKAGFEIWVDSAIPVGHTTLKEIGAPQFFQEVHPQLKLKQEKSLPTFSE